MSLGRAHTLRRPSVSCLQVYSDSVCSSDSSLIDKTALIFNRDNFNFYLHDALNEILATATCLHGWLAVWLDGWVSVHHTRRYCIKTAKPIWKKVLRASESTIVLVSWDLCADTQFHGELLQRGDVKYTGWEKLANFVLFSTNIAVYIGNGVR